MCPHRQRPSPTPPKGIRSQLQGFFSLPPAETPEGASSARSPGKDSDESDDIAQPAGCLAFVVVVIVSKIAEDMLSLSDAQRYLGLGVFAVVAMTAGLWTRLHDSDLAYSDRDSDGRMARFRNTLRRLFNIPVI